MEKLEAELKGLMIELFELEGLCAEDINSDSLLFGAGLGLDSIDALELGVALKKKYHIHFDSHRDSTELAKHFSSIKNLARFVAINRE